MNIDDIKKHPQQRTRKFLAWALIAGSIAAMISRVNAFVSSGEAAELIANSKSEQRAPRFTIFRR